MDLLQSVWKWLSNPAHQKTLSFLGGAVVVVATALWTVFRHFSKKTSDESVSDLCGQGQNPTAGDISVIQTGSGKISISHYINHAESSASWKKGNAPSPPALVVGRNDALRDLKEKFGIDGKGPRRRSSYLLVAVRGWPGVGKTTLAALMAHDPDVEEKFSDGVLWTSLGQNPDTFAEITAWGRAVGCEELVHSETIEEASARLSAFLRDKRMLLIIDDVWESAHAMPLKVGGKNCATLVTTREPQVAEALTTSPEDVYRLRVLADADGIELLQELAPDVISAYHQEAQTLVHELEGLPLALQVAGRLLNAEYKLGFGITDLLHDITSGAKLLETAAPSDRTELALETIPSVAALLMKSTDRLDLETRERFAMMAAFAPRPASFDLDALSYIWEVADPRSTVRTLVNRGLLEPADSGRFQVHALLVLHASSLLPDD